MTDKTYVGVVTPGELNWKVYIERPGKPRRKLPLCTWIRNHSPTGFAWGYGGSGPAQLALALLVDATNKNAATELYQAFKWERIAKLAKDEGWTISQDEIVQWVKGRLETQDAETRPDWNGKCSNCGESPIVPLTGMCGPCTFGEAATAGGNW